MAAWRKEGVNVARHRQEKREATRLENLLSHTEAYNFTKQHPLTLSKSLRNPCTDGRPTETCVAPVDASRDFLIFFSSNEKCVCVGGGMLPDFFLLFSFPCSANHERDWPPCKIVFFGLATNTLNVRNNKQQLSF